MIYFKSKSLKHYWMAMHCSPALKVLGFLVPAGLYALRCGGIHSGLRAVRCVRDCVRGWERTVLREQSIFELRCVDAPLPVRVFVSYGDDSRNSLSENKT